MEPLSPPNPPPFPSGQHWAGATAEWLRLQDLWSWTRLDALSVGDWRAIGSNVFLFGLILGMAGTIDARKFWLRIGEGRGIILGLLCQFALLPLLGFTVVRVFDLDSVAGITLLITTTSPGGGFSGLLCFLCNADLALSVAMTSVSTVASMALIPFNAYLYIHRVYGVSVALPWTGLIITVGVVIVAVAVGLTLSATRPAWKTTLSRIGTVCGLLNILIAGASSSTSDTPFWSHRPLFMLAIGLPCLVGLIVSFVTSKVLLGMEAPQAVAIAIECCYQNTALAVRCHRFERSGTLGAWAAHALRARCALPRMPRCRSRWPCRCFGTRPGTPSAFLSSTALPSPLSLGPSACWPGDWTGPTAAGTCPSSRGSLGTTSPRTRSRRPDERRRSIDETQSIRARARFAPRGRSTRENQVHVGVVCTAPNRQKSHATVGACSFRRPRFVPKGQLA